MVLFAVPGTAGRPAQSGTDPFQSGAFPPGLEAWERWDIEGGEVVQDLNAVQFVKRPRPYGLQFRNAGRPHHRYRMLVGVMFHQGQFHRRSRHPVIELAHEEVAGRIQRRRRSKGRIGRRQFQGIVQLQPPFQRVQPQDGADRFQKTQAGHDLHLRPSQLPEEQAGGRLSHQGMARHAVEERPFGGGQETGDDRLIDLVKVPAGLVAFIQGTQFQVGRQVGDDRVLGGAQVEDMGLPQEVPGLAGQVLRPARSQADDDEARCHGCPPVLNSAPAGPAPPFPGRQCPSG